VIDTQGAFDHAAQPHNKEQAQHCAGAHLFAFASLGSTDPKCSGFLISRVRDISFSIALDCFGLICTLRV
jgi:hypothetical protein